MITGVLSLGQAFTALGDRLARRGVVADVFVVGGAAMALAYDVSRVTRDVDARFVPHGIVLEEARLVPADMHEPATPNAACLVPGAQPAWSGFLPWQR
jgi:hypothetical protein